MACLFKIPVSLYTGNFTKSSNKSLWLWNSRTQYYCLTNCFEFAFKDTKITSRSQADDKNTLIEKFDICSLLYKSAVFKLNFVLLFTQKRLTTCFVGGQWTKQFPYFRQIQKKTHLYGNQAGLSEAHYSSLKIPLFRCHFV